MSEPFFPIYVLSAGRAGYALTCDHLDRASLPYTLLVPEREVDAYRSVYSGHVVSEGASPQERLRIGQARNCILDDAREKSYEWIWMLDDDIIRLHVVREGKITTPSLAALRELEPSIRSFPVAQAGMTGSIPSAKRAPLSWNGYCCNVVAFHIPRMRGFRYDDELHFGEDVELTLQLLTNGERNVRFLTYSYVCKSFGKKGKVYPGGLAPTYQTIPVQGSFETIARRYGPGIARVGCDQAGRPMVIVNWNRFKQNIPKEGFLHA